MPPSHKNAVVRLNSMYWFAMWWIWWINNIQLMGANRLMILGTANWFISFLIKFDGVYDCINHTIHTSHGRFWSALRVPPPLLAIVFYEIVESQAYSQRNVQNRMSCDVVNKYIFLYLLARCEREFRFIQPRKMWKSYCE